MAEQTPPGALPVIKEGMLVRMDLRTAIAIVLALVGGAVFCTAFYNKVDAFDKRLGRIEKALGIDAFAVDPQPHHGATP